MPWSTSAINGRGELGEGPCLDACWQHPTVLVRDLARQTRWPHFTARATGHGLGSLLSVRLGTEPGLGTLTLVDPVPGNPRHPGGVAAMPSGRPPASSCTAKTSPPAKPSHCSSAPPGKPTTPSNTPHPRSSSDQPAATKRPRRRARMTCRRGRVEPTPLSSLTRQGGLRVQRPTLGVAVSFSSPAREASVDTLPRRTRSVARAAQSFHSRSEPSDCPTVPDVSSDSRENSSMDGRSGIFTLERPCCSPSWASCVSSRSQPAQST